MIFLTDENVAASVVKALRQSGHTVVDVKENHWQGKTDSQMLVRAQRAKAIIVTHDKDFLLQVKQSVVLLRFRNQQPNNVVKHLLNFLTSSIMRKKLIRKSLVIISESNVEFHYF